MRHQGSIPIVIAALVATACSSQAGASSCSVDPIDRPAEVVTQPQLAAVPERQSNLGLDVTSTSRRPVRVTVTLDDRLALDVNVPGAGRDCAHRPVYRYTYRLPRGPATVTATTDQGQRDTTTVTVDGGARWIVLQVEEGFPLQVKHFGGRPGYG